jgi:hypothetical protein
MTMTSDEVWDLLEIIASIDRRKLGLTDRQVWEGLIGDLSAADAQAAVIAYYRESREWIMPADVRNRVKAMRRDRLAREIVPAPPAELADDPVRHRAQLQASVRGIADGMTRHLAIAGPVREDPPPQEFTEAREALGPGLPRSKQELAARQAAESRAAREAEDAAGETA